jgi:hypothetical protein
MSSSPFLRLWPLQLLWVATALAVSTSVAAALDGRSGAVVVVVAVGGWAGWTVGLVAQLVPRAVGLTAVRVLAPGAVAVAAAAAALTDQPGPIAWAAVAVSLTALVAALTPWATDTFVDGSSYGTERRLALRTPLGLAAVAVATWALVAVGAVAGPLLLATGSWAVGGAALVVGWAVAALGVRSLHQLSLRWLVLVPTGMVLHDPLTMPEPQLFLRQTMARLGPAERGEDAAAGTEDLTAGASGLVVALELDEPVELLVRAGRGTTLRPVSQVLFSPARPAELLREGTARRLPVG